jgi:alkanesulfonate monooxygenase SsuD/methylene tetrahydromethanopterin reductase-like flavin-dependent oxidoreductase (luciferase family)
VARLGQGWHPLGVSPEGMARRLAVLDEELARHGRSRDDITISLRWDVSPSADVEPWLEEFRELGVHEVVWSVGSPDLDVFRSTFEHLAEVARAAR